METFCVTSGRVLSRKWISWDLRVFCGLRQESLNLSEQSREPRQFLGIKYLLVKIDELELASLQEAHYFQRIALHMVKWCENQFD